MSRICLQVRACSKHTGRGSEWRRRRESGTHTLHFAVACLLIACLLDDMHVFDALALAVEQVHRGVSSKRLLDFKCNHSLTSGRFIKARLRLAVATILLVQVGSLCFSRCGDSCTCLICSPWARCCVAVAEWRGTGPALLLCVCICRQRAGRRAFPVPALCPPRRPAELQGQDRPCHWQMQVRWMGAWVAKVSWH
jgi:hypothetical protein